MFAPKRQTKKDNLGARVRRQVHCHAGANERHARALLAHGLGEGCAGDRHART